MENGLYRYSYHSGGFKALTRKIANAETSALLPWVVHILQSLERDANENFPRVLILLGPGLPLK